MPRPTGAVPTFRALTIPGGAVPLTPVDASSLVDTLRSWQEREQTADLERAKTRAADQGLAEGSAAARARRPLELAGDTEAGRAYTKAARSAYVAGLENDWAETATRLEEAHPLDASKFSDAAQSYVAGSLRGLDDATAAAARERADAIFGQSQRRIIGATAEKGREEQGAALQAALGRRRGDLLRLFRSGDTGQAVGLAALIEDDLSAGVAAGSLKAPWAEAYRAKLKTEAVGERYFGDFDDAKDKEAWLERFRKSRPAGLTPEEHENLVNRIEGFHKEGLDRSRLGQAQEVVDAAMEWDGSPAERREVVRRVTAADPEVRKQAEALLETRLHQDQQDRDRAEKDRQRAQQETIVGLVTDGRTGDAMLALLSARLPPEDHKKFADYIRQRAQGEEPIMGPEAKDTYRALRQRYSEDPKAFLAEVRPRLSALRAEFNDAHHERVLDLVDRARREVETDEDRAEAKADRTAAKADREALQSARRLEALTNRQAAALADRINPKASPEKRRELLAGIKDAVEELRWEGWEPKDEADVTRTLDRLLLEKLRGSRSPWFSTDTTIEGVPDKEVQAIRDDLEAEGERATPEAIAKTWQARQAKEGK